MAPAKDISWLRPRGYIHLTNKFNRDDIEDVKFLTSYVSTPTTVAKHSFYPLIHRPMISRRYKKFADGSGKSKRRHSYFDIETGKRSSTAKVRHIYYATHLDSFIYSYYSKVILSPLYEQVISLHPGLSDSICAYRKIPVKLGSENNKSNIHFADDVFKFIKSFGNCTALTFDVSAFFDSIDQKILKQQWTKLLGRKDLPPDHHALYKSLTRVSYVEYYKVLKEFKIKNPNKLRSKKYISFCDSSETFKQKVSRNGLINKHPFKDKKGNFIGIPQGTPISAFLSNLYLLEFDQMVFEKISACGGLYKRYSDDIVVICKQDKENELKEFIVNLISEKFKLIINPDKVEVSKFSGAQSNLSCDIPLRYLGFEFDGKRALIKSASLAKFYRQMKRAVRAQALKANHNRSKKGASRYSAKIYAHDLFKTYSHLATKGQDRNFYVYAKEASKIMKEPAIMGQLSNSWENLNSEIAKYEKKFRLRKKPPVISN